MEKRVTVLEVEVKHLREDMATIMTQQKELISQLNRYKGAWGAIVMIGAALVAALTLGLKYFGLK